ncbi:MAG: ABC transporter permease, partial [Defluviitaleaceae bacterium]|nr:ABC transporter permease [Defluviitaleaceae bacterium]
RMWPDAPVPIRPSRFWGDMLVLYPLNAELGIDKMSLAHGERVDFTEPELAHLPELMWQWHWEMRRMYVSTVTDMSIMQKMASNPIMLITEGRQITMDDYREARPVAVIHREFARERDLPIGSILTIDIPRYQYYDGIFTGAGFSDILVRSQIAEQPYHLLELEIIGHFVFRPDGARLRELAYVFVPDSLIPAHIVVNTPETGPMANWQPDHIPNHMMTFLLADTRAEQGFEMAYFERFAELGLQLNVVGANSGGFWALADPILMIIAFNAVVFWVVLLMVMALVVFLFLRQRRRDFAILRALGASRGLVMWRLFVAALVLGIPAVALGGGLAWIFGNATAADTMAPLMELQGIGIMPPLGLVWLMGFFGIVLGLMLIMALSGGARILSQPVLVLLQNQQAKYSFAKAGVVGGGDGLNAPDISQLQIALPKDGLQKSFKWRMGNNFRWIRRHISRAPAKAALGLAVALFFVLALGWLQEAIDRTQNDIDRFYNETVVSGQLRAVGTPAGFGAQMIWGGAPGDHVGGFIHSRTRRALMGLEFIERFHMESGHTRSIIIPYGDGVFDNNWFDHVEFDLALATHSFQNLLALDFLHGVNDYDLFISEHSGFLSADMPDIEITFAPGFDGSMFDRVEQVGSIMPIVLYQGLLEQWGFELGDSVFLVFARGRSMLNHEHRRAIIAGVHNGHIYRTNLNDSVVMNLQYKESFMGMMTIYLGIAFDIDTAYNRDLEYVRDSLTHAIFSFEAGPGLAPLGLFLEDEEMRNVIAAMEQSLLLLELLYPIAIALAVAIGAGLSMLLMLQGVRNAAIMRVLGGTRRKTSGMLITEQLLISAIGIFAGFLVLVILSWGFGAIYSLQIAAVYLAGAVVGSIAGAIVVTGKAPLDLLQVRE